MKNRQIYPSKVVYQVQLTPVRLSEYAPEFGNRTLYVWNNPPADFRKRYIDLVLSIRDLFRKIAAGETSPAIYDQLRHNNAELLKMHSALLSKGPGDAAITGEELREFLADCRDRDPRLSAWLLNKIFKILGFDVTL